MANYQLSYTGAQVNDAVKQVVSQEFDNVMTGVSPNSSANDTSLVTAEWVKDYAPSLSNTFLLKPTARLSSGANLNTYTTPGCWICTSATIAANITNSPVTNGGFTLRVMTGTGGSWVVQEVISGYGFRYFRYYTGSTWGSWNVDLITNSDGNYTQSNPPSGVTIKKVWENAAPTSAFNAQDINIDLSNAQGVSILWAVSIYDVNRVFNTGLIPIGKAYRLEDTFYENGQYTIYRWGNIAESGIGISDAERNGVSNNGFAIPLVIYVYKGVS